MTQSEDQHLDIIVLVARRWKVVVCFVILGVGSAIAYGLLAPEWYAATLRVVPSVRAEETAAASLAAKLPIGLDAIATDVQRIQTVLRSDSVSDEVIAKFRLQNRYDNPHIEHARATLWKHCGTAVDRKANVVVLRCEDKDPQVAKDMTAFFGEVGNKVFRRVSATSTAEERKFLETQVVKARQDVDDASQKLRAFQEKHKVIDLPEQSKATISAMATIQGELLSKQLELSYLTSFSSRTESNVLQLQKQIAIMEAQLRQLEVSKPAPAGATAGSGSASFFPNALSVPELRFELEQLMREQKIKETVFFLMTQRFEMAKIDEARDTSTFQILDNPTLPTTRARPERTKLAVFGLFAGLALALAWIVTPAWVRQRMQRARD